jgi:hypothetical protein
MANKIKEIKAFISGIVSSFSSSDIKDDAASYSLNVDSSDKDGVISGVRENIIKINSDEVKSSTAVSIESSNDTFDLVYADKDDGSIKVLEDVYNTKNVTTPDNASAPGSSPNTMEANNKKVYVGYGKNLNPKIVYKTKNVPFAEPNTDYSNWIYENGTTYDERLLNSSYNINRLIPVPGNTDSDCKTAVGIRYDHKDLYYCNFRADYDTTNKVYDFLATNKSAKIDLGVSNNGKGTLAGAAADICQAEVFDYSEGNQTNFKFWVLSNLSESSDDPISNPIVEKYDLTTLPDGTENGNVEKEFQFTVDFGDYPPPAGAVPASILETKNKLWIQYWKPSGDRFDRKQPFLWCADIPTASGHIAFENKSLYYDKISKRTASFRIGWIKELSEQLVERYFRNDDEPRHGLDNTDWNKGDESWGDASSKRGQEYYSGLYQPNEDGDGYDTGFKIARHGLIQSPLIDNANGQSNEFLEETIGYSDEDEDWVSVVGQCVPSALNIYTAQEYKVNANYFLGVRISDEYRKLRAADDNGGGSNVMGGAGGNFSDFINGFINNIMYTIFTIIIGGIAALVQSGLGLVNPSVMVRWLNDVIYGSDSVNWFYNGKCFEGGVLNNVLISIGSNHDPLKKFDVTDGARLHLRELYGFDSSLEIVDVRHYFDRLMISCYKDTADEDIDSSTLFLMYNTSESSLTNKDENLIAPVVLDPVRLEENSDPNAEWYDLVEQLRDSTVVPDLYTDLAYEGSDLDKIPNKVIQAYLPITDFEINDFGIYPELNDGIDTWPHVDAHWWQTQDNELAILHNNLIVLDDLGVVHSTAKASFNIWLKPGTTFNGRTYIDAVPGWSDQTVINDHICFLSSTGPFNIAKFNFLKAKNNDSAYNESQAGMPENSIDLFPDDHIAILGLNTEPNTPIHNIKQYSLDSKSLSFKVKASTYDGADPSFAPFIYSDEEGLKEIYRYKINFVYDGYQDSPLSNHYTEVDIREANVRADGGGAGTDYVAGALTVTINLHKPEIFSRRITHARLWKSKIRINESTINSEDNFNIESMYNLVDTIPLNSNWTVSDEVVEEYNGNTVTLGKIANYTVIDNGKVGPSYEAYTGIPQAIKNSLPSYTLSTQLNNYLYIANCSHPSFEDASNLIFRSQPSRYNIFDWSENLLSMPSTPKAMTSFNGRLIVWDFKNMYIINPEGLYIEDTFESSGCLGYNHFARTEQGICFADDNNIYLYDGKQVNNIGIPIVTSHKYGRKISWRNKDNEYDSIIRYNSEIRSFCVFIKAEMQSDLTWLQRAEKGKDYFVRFDNSSPLIRRWFDITNANINWEIAEQQPKYIFHRGMWEQYFQNGQDQSIPSSDSSFVEDYYYEPFDIYLPYGTGYEIETGRYVVDLPAMLYGLGYITLDANVSLNENDNALYSLQDGDMPLANEIFEEGKLLSETLSHYYCFTYNIDKKRWDLLKTNEFNGVFNGPKGELYTSSKIGESFILDIENLSESADFELANNTPIGGKANILSELSGILIEENPTGNYDVIHNAQVYSAVEKNFQVYSPNGEYLDTDRDGDLNDEVPNNNDYNGQNTYLEGYFNMTPQIMPGDNFADGRIGVTNQWLEVENINIDNYLHDDYNPAAKIRFYEWLVPVNNMDLSGWPQMEAGDKVYFSDAGAWDGEHIIFARGASRQIGSMTVVPYYLLEDWNNNLSILSSARWEFRTTPVPQEEGDEQFLNLGVGDINRDGGVNILDFAVANSQYNYIVIAGHGLKTYRTIISEGHHTYPDIYLIDEQSTNNYHKLKIHHAYYPVINNIEYTYCLIPKWIYPHEESNLGWNQEASEPLPEGTGILLNENSIGLEGDNVLQEMFKSKKRKQFVYTSKNFYLSENSTVNKILSKIKIVYKNTPPIFEYMINNDDKWLAPDIDSIEDKNYCLSYKIPRQYKKVKSIKVKIISQYESYSKNYDTEVDSFSIIYRERGNA